MAGQLGRVLVGGRDCGAGFALGPRVVVTAHHVVRGRKDKPVVYVPAGGEPVGVERVQPDVGHDAAIMWLVGDVGEFLPTSAAVPGAGWRVESPPPGGNDPQLHGTVTTARMTIHNAKGQTVEVVQLQVDEALGGFGGYSGSAVLDSLGLVAVALLVEQKPLRTNTPVAPGERRVAANVLYAVPIGDVITAFGLPVRTARPLRFDVELLPAGMVTRPGLLDETVGRVIGAEGGDAGAGLVVLRGLGGRGKTVLARQVAEDVRVWAEFTAGIVMLRAGQAATADGVARQLQETLGCRDRYLADVLDGQRLLLIVDDVWDRELLATLRAGLPPTVTVLATTRGVFAPGAAAVPVGAVGREEAIQILARGIARSDELDRALASLAETLFHWALLLTLAAAEIHRDNELGWGIDGETNSHQRIAEPDVLKRRAHILEREFPDDPTRLDELEPTAKDAPPRSLDVLVHRSLEWLGPERQARFELLAVYPPGAAITQPMLEDLWQISPNATRKQIELLVRAGLAQPTRKDPLTIELHDLITAWLHYACGHPGDARHQPVHQRLAGLCLLPDGSPTSLTGDRAEWLVYHLVSAGAWDSLKALPTLRWRSAFLVATGSDAVFLGALDQYGDAALAQAPDALYHAVRAWLFAAHVRDLTGRLPISVLVAMALAGDPIAAITQACQHPKAGRAVLAVLAAVADRLDTRRLIERPLALVQTILEDPDRSQVLANIAEQLAGGIVTDPALIERALAVTETIPDDWWRSQVLAGIAGQLAVIDPARGAALIERALAVAETVPSDGVRRGALASIARRLAAAGATAPALIERALAVAETIADDDDRSGALADIAEQLAGAAVTNPALIERALAVIGTIPDDWRRSQALADIAEQLAAAGATNPALIERALAVAETIADDKARSRALADIATRLAGIGPADPALIERALAAAETIRDDWERSDALPGIAEWLAAAGATDPALIERALAVAETIPSDLRHSEALAGIAEQLAAAAAANPALIERALAVADTILSDDDRSGALAGIAKRLAAAGATDPALIERALAVADTIPSDRRRGWALTGIAEQLAAAGATNSALIERALAVAETIPDDWRRSQALAGIAEQLAAAGATNPALIERALAVAETIPSDNQRSKVLAGIAEQLAAAGATNPALIERAVAAAQTIPDYQLRSEALARIAAQLGVIDPARAGALIERALAVAETIRSDAHRSIELARMAEQLARACPTDRALIERALAVAETIPGDDRRNGALGGIAEQLAAAGATDPALIERALAVAETISSGLPRSVALAGIAGQLAVIDPARAGPLIEQALAVAEIIPSDRERGWALANIAKRLTAAGPTDPGLIEQALAVAETVRSDSRGWPLAEIAAWLAATDPTDPALIKRALTVAETIPGLERDEALAGIAEQLAAAGATDPALIERAVAMADTIPRDDRRNGALADIARRLADIDPAQAAALIERAQTGAETITDGWQRSNVLANIAGRLAGAGATAPALIERAVAVAVAIPNDDIRRNVLADIAGRLAGAGATAPALIERVQAAAETVPEEERSWVLARIHALTRNSMLDELSRWRLRSVGGSIDLLNVFLKNSHDKELAESIGLAVLDVAIEFSSKMLFSAATNRLCSTAARFGRRLHHYEGPPTGQAWHSSWFSLGR